MNWLLFYIVLFAPAVLNLVGMLTNAGVLIVGSTFAGSVIVGVICGQMLGLRYGMSKVLTVLLVVAFIVTSFILCFLGCVFSVQFTH